MKQLKKPSKSSEHASSSGFTIIELLIATMVFASVLVLITVGILNFTKTYFRGVNQSNTQTVARTIVEGISQSIQFTGDVVTSPGMNGPGNSKSFCIGDQLYSYILGWQVVDCMPDTSFNETNHGLLYTKLSSCSGTKAINVRNPSAAELKLSTELLSPHMRLAKLDVKPDASGDPNVWHITARVVYGDNDLLCSPSTPGDCTSNGTSSPLGKTDLTCKAAIKGSQYCAVSELSTVVKKRITTSP